MKIYIAALLLLSNLFIGNAQEVDEVSGPQVDPGKGKINVQFVAGILNATPVGVEARMMRNQIKDMENSNSSYSASLLPKTSAYVGVNVDYQFHKIGAIGFGVTYTPKGYWFFEKDTDLDLRKKTFITVDYFEIPIFYKEYLMDNKFAVRFGPVINLAVISKNRTITTIAGEKTKEKSRLGENGDPLPREIVPGFEAAVSFGDLGGFHGNFQFQYMGSMFKDQAEMDLRSVIFKVGVGYTFSK
ncbi:MAG: outer membrane beta-barrel protein [Chitinophagales bacterium]